MQCVVGFVETADPASVHIDVLKARVNEIETAAVGFLTESWPAPSGGITVRDISLFGPATCTPTAGVRKSE